MAKRLRRGLSPLQLRLFLGLLALALAVPLGILILQTQRQIKWEAFHQYRTLAEEMALRIDADLRGLIAAEEARAVTDYQFVVVGGDPQAANFLERSSLAKFPVASSIPGLIGYFQVDANGVFSTPLLPDQLSDSTRWGIDAGELAQRQALRDKLFDVLTRNRLLEENPDRQRLAERALQKSEAGNSSVASLGRLSPQNEDAVAAVDADLEGGAKPAQDKAKDSIAPAPVPEQSADVVEVEAPTSTPQGSAPPTQVAFDQLNARVDQKQRSQRKKIASVDELRIEQNYQKAIPEQETLAAPNELQQLKENVLPRASRKEQSAVVESTALEDSVGGKTNARQVRIFESDIDPFEFSLLDSGHGVLFRRVWRDGQRTIQGALLEQEAFLHGVIAQAFQNTALAQMSDLLVTYRDDVLQATRGSAASDYSSSAEELTGELLHQVRLSAPLGDFQLLWTINRLPPGPGARIVAWTSLVLFGVLVLGFLALYGLGMRQILLARQQQDFVSAVSHELKTPLTSIRMYAEMLREGWAGEAKKREYYAYIHDESERLSRLIANVLQLARMEHNEQRLDAKPYSVAALMDMLRSKTHSQIERAGFESTYNVDPNGAVRELLVDADAFIQILINLVDNAIKFSASAERKAVEITAQARGDRAVVWSVRDYGPGVPKSQMKKIFKLFYRSGSELTRETLGTGIGLALVRQLAAAMSGTVDVVNRDPGAEFQLCLPVRETTQATT